MHLSTNWQTREYIVVFYIKQVIYGATLIVAFLFL